MLYISGIILAFFLAALLLTKQYKSTADGILVIWLTATGFHLSSFYLFISGEYIHWPTLVVLGFPLPLVQGPFLYLYTFQQTENKPFRVMRLLHFLPALGSLIMFGGFFILPAAQQVQILQSKGKGYEWQMLINISAIYISGLVYIPLSIVRLMRYKKSIVHQFSNTEKINFNWLLYLAVWLAAIWIIVLFVHEDKLVFAAAALFVVWLGYFSIRQVQVFATTPRALHPVPDPKPGPPANDENIKYQKSPLTQADAIVIHERLKKLFIEEKPYCDPDLTLDNLARQLNIHPNYLSQVINSRESKTFYDLINEKRVEEFIYLLSQQSHEQFTLISIAYDCGFNSKASFNRNFKKCTGLTPSEYLKKLELAAA